jgi:Tol biopolymer transport system component
MQNALLLAPGGVVRLRHSHMSLALGTRLGPYVVNAQIGQGGMGEVYGATDTNLKRTVAIKVLPDEVAGDHDRLARFQREAEVLAALNHPNIAQIYDLERSADVTALVMELVDGPTLAEVIDMTGEGGLPLDQALPIARQIAAALEAAHEQGIVHRDLKPANVMLKGVWGPTHAHRPDGNRLPTLAAADLAGCTVKVLDFGLSKSLDPPPAAGSITNSPTITSPAMTQMGLILGTAAYMSPEQARGRAVDKRADIWAFGCVLYEMITGRRLFDGADLTDTIAAVVRHEPDLTSVPRVVRRLLAKCLEKDPTRRLRDIGDAWQLLDDDPEPVGDRAGAARRLSRVLPWAIAAVSTLAAVAALGGLWRRPQAHPEVLRFQIHAPAGARLPPGTPAVSPDGRTLAYRVVDVDGTARIHVHPIDQVESRVLPGTEGAGHLFWSPDGHALAFAVERRLRRIDLAGGAARDLATVMGPWHGTWGRQDDILFLGDQGINRISAGGGAVASVGPGVFPAFLPDGQRFLLFGQGGIQLGRLGSTARAMVLADVASAPILSPTPAGPSFLLYLRERDLVAQEFDDRAGTVRGPEVVVVPSVGTVANPALRPAIGVSASGTIAYQSATDDRNGQLTWYDRAGKPLQSLPVDLFVRDPDLSPNGSLVVGTRVGAFREVHIVDLDRGLRRRVALESHSTFGVRWSPDGTRLALGQNQRPLLLVDAASGSAKPLADMGTLGAWSPDGRYLLSSLGPGTRARLVPVEGTGEAIELGPRVVSQGQGDFSLDGKLIALTIRENGRDDVYVQRAPPAAEFTQISLNGGSNPRWGKDSSQLFFLSDEGAIMAADVRPGTPITASVPRELFRPSGSRLSFDVTADGQRFLVSSSSPNQGNVPITVVVNWWSELVARR